MQSASDTAITLGENLARLREVSQLNGVPIESANGKDAAEVAHNAWRAQVRADLHTLTEQWKSEYEKNLNQCDIVTVAIERDWTGNIASEDVSAAVRIFPHTQGPGGFIGNYPEILSLWMRGVYDDMVTCSDTLAANDVTLETAAALWQPSDDTSPYRDVSVAVRAAQQL